MKTLATGSTVGAMKAHARTGDKGVTVSPFSETRPTTVQIGGDAFKNTRTLLHDARTAETARNEVRLGSKTVTRQLRKIIERRSDEVIVDPSGAKVVGIDHARDTMRTVLRNGSAITRPIYGSSQVRRPARTEGSLGSKVSSDYRLGRGLGAMRAEAAARGAEGPSPQRGDKVSVTTYNDARTLVWGDGRAGVWKFWR